MYIYIIYTITHTYILNASNVHKRLLFLIFATMKGFNWMLLIIKLNSNTLDIVNSLFIIHSN